MNEVEGLQVVDAKFVLNVGGGPSRILPERYNGWHQDLLDIDPDVNPDICVDALKLKDLELQYKYDAIYNSHCLEHFYKHEVQTVLKGFLHALKDAGFVEIHVPNLLNLFQEILGRGLDVDDVWYRAGGPNGAPISFHDVLYGWNHAMSNGNIFYSHKCGFTAVSLNKELVNAGFGSVYVQEQGANLMAIAYKNKQE